MRCNRNRITAIGLVGALALSTGCAAVGNVFFSPHPASLKKPDPKVEFKAACTPPPAAAAVGSAAAAGVALAAFQAMLEAEAKRYKATWSASGSTSDLLMNPCVELVSPSTATLELPVDKSGGSAFRIENGTFDPEGTKSKVAAWPLQTWVKTEKFPWPDSGSGKIGTLFGFVNPFMLLHFVYGLFDGGIYEVDYAAKLRVESIGANGKPQTTEVVIPLGKHDIDKIAKKETSKRGLETGYFGRPAGGSLPTNATVTIIEANDLGDVIGKGAKLVGENEGGIKKFFGLE